MKNSQSAIAYEKIKDMIFHMELLPGTKISEVQLSQQLGVSRTPVHDALRRLASEGLVGSETNRSAVVTEFSEAEKQELGALRLAQDVLACDLASYYGSAADFDRLYRMAEEGETCAKSGDVFGRIHLDMAFHLEIARISGNQHLLRQQNAIYQQIHLIQIAGYTNIQSSLTQIRHHRPLVDAISAGDTRTLHHLICEHLQEFFQLDPYLLQCYDPDGDWMKSAKR